MATDFRANQIQTRHLIASGSFSGPGAGSQIAITRMENDTAPLNQGNINAAVLAEIEQGDVFFFVSGSIGGKDGTTRGITLLGGDLHISGNISVGGSGLASSLDSSINAAAPDNDVSVPSANPVILRDGGAAGFDLFSLARTGAGAGDALAISMSNGTTGRAISIDFETAAASSTNYFEVTRGNDRISHGVGWLEIANHDYGGYDMYCTAPTALSNNPGLYITVTAGPGDGTGAGGDLNLFGGTAGGGGTGGGVYVQGGLGGSASGNSGPLEFFGGSANSVTGTPGTATFSGGENDFGGTGGTAIVRGGRSTGGTGKGGDTFIQGGTAVSTGLGGNVYISGGGSVSGTSGSVFISGSRINIGNSNGTSNLHVSGTVVFDGNMTVSGNMITTFNNAYKSRDFTDSSNIELIKFTSSPLGDNDASISIGGTGVDTVFFNAGPAPMGIHRLSGAFAFTQYGMSISPDFDTIFAGKRDKDVYFFVDGVPGSRGTSVQGVALFDGDLHVSGNITSDRTFGLPSRVHVGDYVSTTAVLAAPQAAGGVSFDPTEYHTGSCVLASVMAATVLGTTASVMLYNSTSGSYVEIGGPGITYLHVTASNATKVESVNLFEAANFGASESIYLIQVHTTGSVLNTVIHYGSDLVTYR